MEGMVSRIEQMVSAMNTHIQVVTASHSQLVTLNARMFERQQTLETLLSTTETSRTQSEKALEKLVSRVDRMDGTIASLAAGTGQASEGTGSIAALSSRLDRLDGAVEGIRQETISALGRIDANIASRLQRVEGEICKTSAFKSTAGMIGAGLCLATVAGAAVTLMVRHRGRLLVRPGGGGTEAE